MNHRDIQKEEKINYKIINSTHTHAHTYKWGYACTSERVRHNESKLAIITLVMYKQIIMAKDIYVHIS